MPESRNDKRKERYRELRALRFTPEQARRLRDRSGKEIQLAIARERRRISRKPEHKRTAEEQFRFRRLEDRRIAGTTVREQSRFESREERWKKFSAFSSSGKWPRDLRVIARQYNIEAGKESVDDSYGYRRLYYFFVERMPEERSEILAERNDSNARYFMDEPLVRGRQNLRRLLESPRARERRLAAS